MAAAAISTMAFMSGCSESPIDRLRARLELKQGNLSYLRGDYRTAIQHYDRAVLAVHDDSRASLNKAYSWVALFRVGTGREVRLELADSAIASFRHYDTLRQRGRQRSASELDSPQVEKHILSLLFDSGQSDRAIREVLRPRLERNPQDVTTLLMLANLASERGALEETLDYHRKRLAIEPQNPAAHYGLAVVAWKFSHYNRVAPEHRVALLEEGLRAGLRAVELEPDDADALTYLNLLYREMAKYAADGHGARGLRGKVHAVREAGETGS